MGETILIKIVSEVLEKLGSLALREVGLEKLVSNLKSLEGTLLMIQAVVLAGDGAKKQQRETDHYLLTTWLKRLENAFYHADNVLDDLHYQALHRQVLRSSRWSVQAKVHEFHLCTSMSPLVFRSRMSRIIRDIRDRLHRITDDRARFCLMMPEERSESNDEQESSSMSTSLNELDFLGRANDIEAILSLLITSSVDEKLSVIPIVGHGGLGKTTLVKLVFNSERIAGHFELMMWVTLAQHFNCKHAMKKIVQCHSDSPCDNLDDEKKLRILFQER